MSPVVDYIGPGRKLLRGDLGNLDGDIGITWKIQGNQKNVMHMLLLRYNIYVAA